MTDTNSPWGAALRKHSSTAPSVTSLAEGTFQGCCALRGVAAPGCVQWELDNLQWLATLPGRNAYMLDAIATSTCRSTGAAWKALSAISARGSAGTRTALGSFPFRPLGTARWSVLQPCRDEL